MGETRAGIGYDVHRLVAGRPLVLGGVTIPSARGLLGHSDADVALHAIMDALLGAAGLGDIGLHFPPDDPAYRNSNSRVLLGAVRLTLAHNGWRVVNIDCTIVAERPKIMPHVPAMRAAIGETLGLPPDRVSIKATTNEALGFIGREEGVAALAVAQIAQREQDSYVATFRATLDVVGTAEGGRRTPFGSGYRPHFHVPAYGGLNDVTITVEEPATGRCGPGERCTATLRFHHPEFVTGPVHEGLSFEVREASITVARGMVTAILEQITEERVRELRQEHQERWWSTQLQRATPPQSDLHGRNGEP